MYVDRRGVFEDCILILYLSDWFLLLCVIVVVFNVVLRFIVTTCASF